MPLLEYPRSQSDQMNGGLEIYLLPLPTQKHHSDAFRRIESVAEVKGKLRVLNLKRQDVQNAVACAEHAETLFSSGLADDYH